MPLAASTYCQRIVQMTHPHAGVGLSAQFRYQMRPWNPVSFHPDILSVNKPCYLERIASISFALASSPRSE